MNCLAFYFIFVEAKTLFLFFFFFPPFQRIILNRFDHIYIVEFSQLPNLGCSSCWILLGFFIHFSFIYRFFVLLSFLIGTRYTQQCKCIEIQKICMKWCFNNCEFNAIPTIANNSKYHTCHLVHVHARVHSYSSVSSISVTISATDSVTMNFFTLFARVCFLIYQNYCIRISNSHWIGWGVFFFLIPRRNVYTFPIITLPNCLMNRLCARCVSVYILRIVFINLADSFVNLLLGSARFGLVWFGSAYVYCLT